MSVIDQDQLILLAIETTCDETAAAVLEGPRPPGIGVPRIRSSVVSSQVGLHQRYGGVVPEIASRAHVRQVVPMIDQALDRAGVSLARLDAVAVATRPGRAIRRPSLFHDLFCMTTGSSGVSRV